MQTLAPLSRQHTRARHKNCPSSKRISIIGNLHTNEFDALQNCLVHGRLVTPCVGSTYRTQSKPVRRPQPRRLSMSFICSASCSPVWPRNSEVCGRTRKCMNTSVVCPARTFRCALRVGRRVEVVNGRGGQPTGRRLHIETKPPGAYTRAYNTRTTSTHTQTRMTNEIVCYVPTAPSSQPSTRPTPFPPAHLSSVLSHTLTIL